MKTIDAATLEASCLELIDTMSEDGEPIVVTRHGLPVALISPIGVRARRGSIIGAMKQGVLRYDDPFSPALSPSEWSARN